MSVQELQSRRDEGSIIDSNFEALKTKTHANKVIASGRGAYSLPFPVFSQNITDDCGVLISVNFTGFTVTQMVAFN